MCNGNEDKDHDERLDEAVDDMIGNGTSLDDATEQHDVDREELSEAFGEEMENRYGGKDDKK